MMDGWRKDSSLVLTRISRSSMTSAFISKVYGTNPQKRSDVVKSTTQTSVPSGDDSLVKERFLISPDGVRNPG